MPLAEETTNPGVQTCRPLPAVVCDPARRTTSRILLRSCDLTFDTMRAELDNEYDKAKSIETPSDVFVRRTLRPKA